MASGEPPEEKEIVEPEARRPLELEPASEPLPAREEDSPAGEEGPAAAEPPLLTPPAARRPVRRAGRLGAWPFTGGNGFAFLGGLFLLLLLLFAAWGAGLLWLPLRVALALFGGAWFLAYPGRALRATARREARPPDWPPLARRSPAFGEGFRTLGVLVAWGLPALALLAATGSAAWTLGGAIAAWALAPAALLGFWLGGKVRHANPLLALRVALAGGRRYLLCLLPGLPWLAARSLVAAASPLGPILEAGAYFGLVVTGRMLGLLVNESPAVGDRVEGIREAD